MATFSMEIPDADVERVIGAVCAAGGYTPTVVDPETGETTANPQTPDAYAKERVIAFLRSQVVAVEGEAAAQAAREAAVADAHGIDIR